MNTNPQTTPIPHSYDNIAEFSDSRNIQPTAPVDIHLQTADIAQIMRADEPGFDDALEALRLAALKEATTFSQGKKILDKIPFGGKIHSDKEVESTMHPSTSEIGNSFVPPFEQNNNPLEMAMDLSRPAASYGGHPENYPDGKRTEPTFRSLNGGEVISRLASNPEAYVDPAVQEALRIGTGLGAMRQQAITQNSQKGDYTLAA